MSCEDAPAGWELILDYVEGRVTDEQRTRVERALGRGDRATLELVDWVTAFRARARSAALASAPPPMVAQRLRRIPSTASGRAKLVEQLRAEPVLDTRLSDRLTGVRGPAYEAGGRFQVTVRARDIDVVLDIAPDGAGCFTVRGQHLPGRPTLPVFAATAHGPYGSITSITGDEHGGFELRAVPPQTTRLSLTNDVVDIAIPAASGWSVR
jgi:hypothetical protein